MFFFCFTPLICNAIISFSAKHDLIFQRYLLNDYFLINTLDYYKIK